MKVLTNNLPPRRAIRSTWLVLVVLLASLATAVRAGAVIHSATVVDGPSNDVLDVDGAAAAPDGSGGIVYRKQVGGAAHIFVAQFLNGHWNPPIQVDAANPYAAMMPVIAAGDGGRLLVVWVQERNVTSRGVTLYGLMGASLQPGASAFGQAIMVDPSVGEPYYGDVSGVAPALAMDPRSGRAYVVYRVITNDCLGNQDPPNSSCPPPGSSTGKLVDVRVARFNYLTWSSLGAVNRAPQVAMRSPTASNAPSIGIDVNGNGILAWQEPGGDGVARIWVRRLFGLAPGNVLEASPEAIGGRAVTSDADAPAVAVSPYGEARIAFRIEGQPGSAVATSQIYMSSISSAFGLNASRLTGAEPIPGAAQGGIGAPSVAIDQRGNFRLAWAQGGMAWELSGSEEVIGSPFEIGPAVAQTVPTAISPAGGGVIAWPASAGGSPIVEVREDQSEGAFQAARLAGTVPGAVGGLSLGGSGRGDALLGWTQGPVGQSEILGDFVQAPPAPFDVSAPSGWVRGRDANITWEPSTDAVAGVLYTVYVDGRARISGLTGLSARLGSAALGDGVHHVQVLATDGSGQQTMSSRHVLKIDANPPIVKLRSIDGGRGIRVRVSDRASGVDAGATRISFGDGARAKGRATVSHLYGRPGSYRIRALVRDGVGNQAIVRLRVRVR